MENIDKHEEKFAENHEKTTKKITMKIITQPGEL